MKKFIYLACCLLSLASCTIVTSSNTPGKLQKAFPKKIIGEYEMKYPSSLETMAEGTGVSSTVSISKTSISIKTGDEVTNLALNDSLFYSTIGKQGYLSLGTAPNFTVLRLVRNGSDLELYTMNGSGSLSKEDLTPFFKEVVEEIDRDENDEETISYKVTIDDAKLEKYFQSELVDKDPIRLIRKK